jgi:hypothetical protein
MQVPAGTVLIGDNAYLFRSPAGAGVTDCFIIGHGATVETGERRFTVPAGCRVNFFAESMKSLKLQAGPIEGFKAISGQNQGAAPRIDPANAFAAGASIRDYILGKAVGSHYKAAPEDDSYLKINQALNDLAERRHLGLQWLPHYVSIRNRTSWFCDTNIWLSKLIEQIRAYDGTIVNFYCAHCRVNILRAHEARTLKTVGSQGLR